MKKSLNVPSLSRREVLAGLVLGVISKSVPASGNLEMVALSSPEEECSQYGLAVEEVFSKETAKAAFAELVRDVREQLFAAELQSVLASVSIHYGRRKKDICNDRFIYGSYSSIDNSIAISPHQNPMNFADTVVHEFLHLLKTNDLISMSAFMEVYNSVKQELGEGNILLAYYLGIEKSLESMAPYKDSPAVQAEELMIRILAEGFFGKMSVPMPQPLVDFYKPLLRTPSLLVDVEARKDFADQLMRQMVNAYQAIEKL